MNGLMCQNTTFTFNVTGKVEKLVKESTVEGYSFKDFVITETGVTNPFPVSPPAEFTVDLIFTEDDKEPSLVLRGGGELNGDEMLKLRNSLGVHPSSIVCQSIREYWSQLPSHFRRSHPVR